MVRIVQGRAARRSRRPSSWARASSTVFTVSGLLPASTPPGSISNTASVTPPAGIPDPNPFNNEAALTVPTTTSADVHLTKQGPATGVRGTNVTYVLTVTNDGPSDAQSVVVTDPPPAGLTAVSLTGACATLPGCTLPAGGSQTVQATFAIPTGYAGPDPIVNTATVSSATSDPSAGNNTTTASTALDVDSADVAIAKSSVGTITAGAQAVYTITVSNNGLSAAPLTRVVDVFDPAVFASVAWQCVPSGTSTCTTPSGTGNIDTLVNVEPGAGNAVVLNVQAQVLPGAQGTATNTASVTTAANVSDPDSANNTATATDPITTVVDIAYTKTGPTTASPGTTLEYTVVVTNNGPSVALDVKVIDVPEQYRPDLEQVLTGAPRRNRCATGDSMPG